MPKKLKKVYKAKSENYLTNPIFILLLVIGAVVIVGTVVISNFIAKTSTENRPLAKGNGAPAGAHYTLNIHAKKTGWNPGEMGGGGSNIFILENVMCKINLIKDSTFFVQDKDCSDGVAEYHLPAPTTVEDPNNTVYSVFMRPLGKPGGKLDMQTCAMYDDDNDPATAAVELCSLEKVHSVRMKGRSTFVNVSNELLSVVATYDFNGDGTAETVRVPLFDTRYPLISDYMWQTQGDIKVAQLRFYPGVVTTFTPVQ